MDYKIEKDDRDGYYYVREREKSQWKMRYRHPDLDSALKSLLKESDNKVTELLRRVARFMCGGHYEPRNDAEAELAKEIFDTIGIT